MPHEVLDMHPEHLAYAVVCLQIGEKSEAADTQRAMQRMASRKVPVQPVLVLNKG